LDQRQDFWEQTQEQRQDFLEDRREDWQNWNDDYYSYHDDWYHGGWGDNWGDYWSHMWDDHTAAMLLGTTWCGLNRMGYWFGTAAYENPYYVESSGPLVIDNTVISYAEALVAAPPLVVNVEAPAQPAAEPELPPGVTQKGLEHFDAARLAFYEGHYQKALDETNKALGAMPTDAMIHEFRALVLFALGNYRHFAPRLVGGPGLGLDDPEQPLSGDRNLHQAVASTRRCRHGQAKGRRREVRAGVPLRDFGP
jgi:hypothetical protein